MERDEAAVRKAWEKGVVVHGNDAGVWRRDDCGAWIGRDYYDNRYSQYGWVLDRIDKSKPVDPSNQRPLHWKNAEASKDGALACPVTADGENNRGVWADAARGKE